MTLYKATADYAAGGYPSPTYEGQVTVGLNASSVDEAEEKAIRMLKTKVARSGAFETRQVKLSNVVVQRDLD